MVFTRGAVLGATTILLAMAGAMPAQDTPGGRGLVFVVLRQQPQKAIFERTRNAAELGRAMLEGRYRLASQGSAAGSQEARRAREAVDQFEVETRQAAFREIRQAIDAEQGEIAAVAAAAGGRNIRRYSGVNMISVDIPVSALDLLRSDPRVAEILPVEKHEALLNASVPELGTPSFWNNGYTGQGQAVAVFDSGVRTDHPAFNGVSITSRVFLDGGSSDSCFGDDASSVEDKVGHGTHVAGIVVSRGTASYPAYVGVARGLGTLYNVKIAFLEKSGTGCTAGSAISYSTDVFQALDWLVSSTPINIVNYSYGSTTGSDDDSSARTWDRYTDNFGLTAAVAAGNNGPRSMTVNTPGTAYNIISVANWVTRGTISSSSSRGTTAGGRYKPDIAAPGTSIESTSYTWDTGPQFVTKTGTSMATPHIAGAAAVLQSAGVASGLATKAVLLNTTDNVGWASDHGWGYANLDTAWNQHGYALGSLTASGSAGSKQFYRAAVAGDFRATVVWNRHVSSSTSQFNNINLYLYNASSSSLLSSSETMLQNVEQVSANGFTGEVVVKPRMATASLAGVSSEPYALAMSASTWELAAAPVLGGSCAGPSSVVVGQAFQLVCTATNNGDLGAFGVTGQITWPSGFTGPSQVVFGYVAGGSSSSLTLDVTAGPAAMYTLQAGLSSTSFGETFTGTIAFTLQALTGIQITTASPLPSGVVGASYSVTLAASGGISPYNWSLLSGALPAGLNLNAAGVIGGTPTAACASCEFTLAVSDSASLFASKMFVLTVDEPLSITTASPLPPVMVGSAYSTTLTASGGIAPYSWDRSGGSLPAGLGLGATGIISGTPTAECSPCTFTARVTDSQGHTASAVFSITSGAALTIASSPLLEAGTVGVYYSASLTANGGFPPYTWFVPAGSLPSGLALNTSGKITGTPAAACDSCEFSVRVTDSFGWSSSKLLTLTVAAALAITTNSRLPEGVVGVAYSASLSATGGAPPYTWSVTSGSLPSGLSLGVDGVIGGTPLEACSVCKFTSRVTDSASFSATKEFSISISLPPAPPVSFTGLNGTVSAADQPSFNVLLGAPYSLPITVTLELTFTPGTASQTDDPSIQFSTGGRSVTFTIPAGQTTASDVSLRLQTGTVAGAIVVSATINAGGRDITPSPLPFVTLTVQPSAPVITSVQTVRTSSGFQVKITGYSTTREMVQAAFAFTAAANATLATSSIMVPLGASFSSWYSEAASSQFGSQFLYTQFFTVQGDANAVGAVSVALINSAGASVTVTSGL
jgi:subtilisin family serine protease